VVTAVLDAGLTLESLQEFPHPDSYRGLGDHATYIPATYLLAASRERDFRGYRKGSRE
jgi:hypothetical protein